MKFGDTITSVGQPLLPGEPAGYNGTDFDLLRSTADNADGIIAITGGQVGAALRTLAQVVGFNGTTFDRIRSGGDNADGYATSSLGVLRVLAETELFNGTTFDRARGNVDGISLANLVAYSTASGNSGDQVNYNGRGVKVVTNLTAISGGGSPSLTVSIKAKDPTSGVYFNVLTGVAITATGTQVLTVYPSLTAVANSVANDVLPRTWRIEWTLAATTTLTATIGGIVLL